MKPYCFALLGLLLSFLPAVAADVPKGFETAGVDVFNKPEIAAQRASNDDLATYVKGLQSVCETTFADTTNPEDLDIVAAVKPGSQAKIWISSSRIPILDDRLTALLTKLQAVQPPPVTGGPIAIIIHGHVAGGNHRFPAKPGSLTMPREWDEAIAKTKPTGPVPFDTMINIVWADNGNESWDRSTTIILTVGFVVVFGFAARMLFLRAKRKI